MHTLLIIIHIVGVSCQDNWPWRDLLAALIGLLARHKYGLDRHKVLLIGGLGAAVGRDGSGDAGRPVAPFAVGAIDYDVGADAGFGVDDGELFGAGEVLVEMGVVEAGTAEEGLDTTVALGVIVVIDAAVGEDLGVVVAPDVERSGLVGNEGATVEIGDTVSVIGLGGGDREAVGRINYQ